MKKVDKFVVKFVAVMVMVLCGTSWAFAQDNCVSGTVPVIGCTIIFDDGNYDLTGDITPTSGSSSIRFNTANRNTFNYTGNINTGATEAGGVFVASSTFNNVTINGNIDVGALGLYGILTGPGAGNNTIIMNGNITTNRYLSYGYYSLFENDTNFTLNGNITTKGLILLVSQYLPVIMLTSR